MNALRNLGPLEAARCVGSYAYAKLRPPRHQDMYEDWLIARFGRRLYRHLFKTYTEKVWGHSPADMPADWAAQRVKNLSLASAIVNAVSPKRDRETITSLIEEFQYPKLGPGMMWERCRALVEQAGAQVEMSTTVTGIRHAAGKATAIVAESDGSTVEYPADAVISSMPLSSLIKAMDPPAPDPVRRAAEGLTYRDFLTVALVVPADAVAWTDNWLYIHDATVRTMRIQNFGSWSPHMVRDGYNVLGLEYTVDEGDTDWTAPDQTLIERGTAELQRLGLLDRAAVQAGYVVRMPKAYPYYDLEYHTNLDTIRRWLTNHAANVHPVGRNGMHRYNNQDHSMYTAMLTVENLLTGSTHDIWSVNVEEEYHEQATTTPDSATDTASRHGPRGTGRQAPVLPARHPGI